MKQFRFSIRQFLALGLGSIVLLAVALLVWPNSLGFLAFSCFIIAGLTGLLIYQKKVYELDEFDNIKYINQQADTSLTTLLENLPVGVIKLSDDGETIEWFNPFAQLIFTQEDGSFDYERFKEIVTVGLDKSRIYAHFSGKRYIVHTDPQHQLFYFFDVSSEYRATQEMTTLRPAIGVIGVDNYDELEDSLSDSDISQVNSFLANFVKEFTDKHQIFYRRMDMDRFLLMTDYAVLERLIEDKFSVVEDFRQSAKANDLPLTISIGFAYGDHNHNEIGQLAIQNLNMAEVRGGDQVVVQENAKHKAPMYFGGNSASTIKRTRTRTRAMMSAISDKIKAADQVFVVGHTRLDMDALGSTVGMQCFAKNLISDAYAVYDETGMSSDVARAIERLKEEALPNFITVVEALSLVTERSLLIMVDHSKIGLTLSEELFSKFQQVIVIDHHRRDSDFPENAVISYIESGASSASELVTELLQFQNGKKERLTRLQASLLMAGIMLDTKNFSVRVTGRTFDVASYLRNCGSDSLEIQTISATDFKEYREVNALILNGQEVLPGIIVAKGDSDKVYDTVIASKAADMLLAMAGIEAAFVITNHEKGYVAVSARSRSQLNVQKLMEELGGGGHFGLAAAQISHQTIDDVYDMLTERLQSVELTIHQE